MAYPCRLCKGYLNISPFISVSVCRPVLLYKHAGWNGSRIFYDVVFLLILLTYVGLVATLAGCTRESMSSGILSCRLVAFILVNLSFPIFAGCAKFWLFVS